MTGRPGLPVPYRWGITALFIFVGVVMVWAVMH